MRLTKYTHACVRLASGGRSLVIDPGIWAEDAALEDVNDILITHEHFDHVDAKRLAGLDLNIYAPDSVVAKLAEDGVAARTVSSGTTFTAAGFSVRAVGGRHAEIYGGMPDCANLGYVIDEDVYHPGDAFFVPDVPLKTLLVPVSAPWLKLGEAITFVRSVEPVRAYPIHDAMFSEIGQTMVDNWLTNAGGTDYQRIANGSSVEI
jgi:L-ascorbate metabolism protein UlaG (beta-lactamase superfamily)